MTIRVWFMEPVQCGRTAEGKVNAYVLTRFVDVSCNEPDFTTAIRNLRETGLRLTDKCWLPPTAILMIEELGL